MEPIGRDAELAEIVERVGAGRRLVTIVGPGGVGKTTLAFAATAVLATDGERRFVALANLASDDAVAGTIAASLGFASFDVALGSGELAGAVVVVDNCEHVAEGAAAAVDALVGSCPTLTVLATSRSPLAVEGESLVALAPLAVPPPGVVDRQCASVAMLCERARDAGVHVAEGDLELAGELCRRVDGVPLAIELAAARLRTMSLAELVAQLGAGVDVLHRPRHRGPARHRSVRDTITWSIDLLEPGDGERLARLAVCPGPFTLPSIARIVDEPLATAAGFLQRAVDASLVEVERRADPTQYRLLEPVRQVAVGQLDAAAELAATRERLTAAVFDSVVEMLGRATRCWWPNLLHDLMAGFEQYAAAIRHCVEHDTDPGRADVFCTVLWGAVHQGRVDDVLTLSHMVMERWPLTRDGTGADAVATYAMARLLHGDLDDAEAIAARALPFTTGSWAAGIGLRRVLGLAARYRGDHERAASLIGEAAAVAATMGADTFHWECRVYAAQDLVALGRSDEALTITGEVGAAASARGSAINEIWANTVHAAAIAAVPRGRDDASRIADETLAESERIGYPFGISCNLQTLALCQLAAGDLGAAAASAARLLERFGRSGPGDLRRALDISAAVLAAAGRAEGGRLAAFARRLPDTNPMIARVELPAGDPAPGMDRASATLLARRALHDLASRPITTSASPAATFTRAGDVWHVSYAGRSVQLVASKGMDDLATLLARPDHDVHCLDLIGAAVEQSGTGEVVDATARRRYEARIRELQADIDDADGTNDIGRSERARAELDLLVDHLTAALSLGGRVRSSGSSSEKARSAVTHRIRKAIDRIAEVHPDLGRHLTHSVRTGHYCSYQPDGVVTWQVAATPAS